MSTPRPIARIAAAASVVVACTALVGPAVASAAPAPPSVADSARAIVESASTQVAGPADLLGLLDTANAALRSLGLSPFLYPTAALNCSAIPGVPLGAVPAIAGAVSGPYGIPIGALQQFTGIDTNIVEKGETLFAFAPAGVINDSGAKTGMRVAWFNINTLQGGITDMGGFGETVLAGLLANVPDLLKPSVTAILTPVVAALPSAGLRLAPVNTGSGTVLAAVFGQVAHDGKTCDFFPTIGISQAR